jgi:hypothetical protein
LPKRLRAAAEFEGALKAVAIAARKFCEEGGTIMKHWPESVPRPDNFFLGYYLSSDRPGAAIQKCFAALLIHVYTRQPASEREFAARAFDADKRATGFAEHEKDQHAKLIAALRDRAMVEPEPERLLANRYRILRR